MALSDNRRFPSKSEKSPFSFMISDPAIVNTLDSGMFTGGIQTDFSNPFSTEAQDPTVFYNELTSNLDTSHGGVSKTETDMARSMETENSGIKKRKRRSKNCSFCRRRKLKCDRQHPCSNCVKRKISSTCCYANDFDGSPPLPVKASLIPAQKNGTSAPSSLLVSDFATTSKTQTISNNTMPHSSIQSSKKPERQQRQQQQSQTSVTFSDFSKEDNSTIFNGTDRGKSVSFEANELKKRLDRMEKLVLSMVMDKNNSTNQTQTLPSGAMSSKGNSTNTTPTTNSSPLSHDTESDSPPRLLNPVCSSEPVNKSDFLGMLKLDNKGKSVYHGDSHWGNLFSEVEQLEDLVKKLTLSKGSTVPITLDDNSIDCRNSEDEAAIHDPINFPFMNPGCSGMSPLDVLAIIPDRHACDILIERYFVFCSPCFQIIHRPTFEKEYNEFWEKPTSFELIWVSMFLGMMVLALQSYCNHEVPEPFQNDGHPEKSWKPWMAGSEVCSYWGKISLKPSLNNVRAIILWILGQASQTSNWDWPETVYSAVGILVRLSQSMGLHRDPKWFAMTPFEAESRRKVWAVVQYLDTHISMVQGLPTIINISGMDVDSPVNIDDKDLIPENDAPVILPYSTRTDMVFTIWRNKIMNWSVLILNLGSSVGLHAVKLGFEKTLHIHTLIRNTFFEAPEYLSTSVLKPETCSCPPDLLLQRVWYEVDYMRLILTLHRPYGPMGVENVKYRRSREESLSASVRLLQLMEWCFGPQAEVMRKNYTWVIGNIFMSHFLSATIYLFLTLVNQYDSFTVDQRIEQIRLVELSVNIFKKVSYTIFPHFKSVTSMLEVLQNELNEVSNLTIQQRNQIVKEKQKRRMENEYSKALGTDAGQFQKGLTMKLNTLDTDIRFDKLLRNFNQLKPWNYNAAMPINGETIDNSSPEWYTENASRGPQDLILNGASLVNNGDMTNIVNDSSNEFLDNLYSASYF